MARIICRLCGATVLPEWGRSRHLKDVHGVMPTKGAVKEYFLHPWEAGEEAEAPR